MKDIPYTAEQITLIQNKLASQDTLNGFVTFKESERIHTREGGQTFAVFGSYAYELHNHVLDTEDSKIEYLPAVMDGKAYGEFPDEGRSGVLHLIRISKSRGRIVDSPEWFALYIGTGWLRTSELGLSTQEITDRITAEIDAGAANITGFQPRG